MKPLHRRGAAHSAAFQTAVVMSAVAVAIVVVVLSDDPVVLTAIGIAGVLCLGLAVKALRGHLDPFEPLVAFAVMWLVMFVFRPIAMVAEHDTSLRETFDASPQLEYAMLLALLGAAAFLAGYSVKRILPHGSRHAAPHAPLSQNSAIVVAAVFGGIGLVAMLATFAQGRAIESTQSGYLIFAPLLLVPACLICLALVDVYRPVVRGAAITACVLLTADYWLVGERFFGLLPLAALAAYFYLARERRPSWIAVVVAVLSLVVVLSLLVNARPGSHPTTTGTPTHFLLDDTTAELPAFSVEIASKGQLWHTSPGYLAYSLVVHWVPGSLWPGKPESYEELLYSRLFPGSFQMAKNGAEFSVLGDFYYDSGVVGIAVGMALLGIACRLFYEELIRRRRTVLASLAYAPVPALMVMLLRGDLTLFAALTLYLYAPFVTLTYLQGRHAQVLARRRVAAVGPHELAADWRSGG